MKTTAVVVAAAAATVAAQNGTALPVSLSLSTQTFTSCTTGPNGILGTLTGVTTVTQPCTHAACIGAAAPTGAVGPTFTTSFSTVYTMYCPTASNDNYLKAYTTTVTETCVGPTPTFSVGKPGYVPNGWTSTVVTCTACGSTPISTGMVFPTAAPPTGAFVPSLAPPAPTGPPSKPGSPAAPGGGAGSPGSPAAPGGGAGSPGSPAAPDGGAGSPGSSCPGGANCPSTGAAKYNNGTTSGTGASTCPGGANCPKTNGTTTPVFTGEAAALPVGSTLLGAAMLVAGAAIAL